MKKSKVKQVKLTVTFPIPEEINEIKKAVKKINETAGNGVDLKLSAFIRNATLEKVRKILKEK